MVAIAKLQLLVLIKVHRQAVLERKNVMFSNDMGIVLILVLAKVISVMGGIQVILREMKIENYRKFLDVSLSFTDDITLLAGANNSGKTSLIDLLGSILGSGRAPFLVSDIPVTQSKKWLEDIYPIFVEFFDNGNDKEQTIKGIIDKTFPHDSEVLVIPEASVKFQIDYSLTDDIRNFADYIMDLDPDCQSFYFKYSFEVTPLSFGQALEDDYEKLKDRYEKVKSDATDPRGPELLKEKILDTYVSSIGGKCYYADRDYKILNEMEVSDFKKLFNIENLCAGRTLDDQSNGKTRNLSKNMIELACHNEDYKSLLKDLPDKILQPIKANEITKIMREASVDGLSDIIQTISSANGGNTGDMILDLDISEGAVNSLVGQTTNVKYKLEDHYLSEASQGLGYSNMIYILLQLEIYKCNIDPLLVNIFIIEEPESHMHPQMQNVFGKYLRKYYQEKQIQGLVTTHSSEMVRVTNMKNLRVARPTSFFNSEIFDFSSFKKDISNDPILSNFFDWFYEIGLSDIVFADRVILYEGDTERMLIRKLTTLKEYQELNNLYIAFVQVGGAYAHNYKCLIEYLKVKTLILTDLDYDKSVKDATEVKASETTNASINCFYEIAKPGEKPKISDLYQWKLEDGNILFNGYTFLSYQDKEDGFSRTLEEAMLAKHYKVDVFVKKTREEWIELRKQDKLKYTIPQDPGEYCLRDIVRHTSNSKTDFMYSVILNGLVEKMLPNYIKEGLEWLIK